MMREVRAMAACLSDEGSGPCEGGIPQLLKKLEHIDRLSADLEAKREAILDRLAVLAVNKTRIDYHYSAQTIMKIWLLFHLPLAVAAMTLAVWHFMLVHVYAL